MYHASFLFWIFPTHQISIFVFTIFSKKPYIKTPSPFPPKHPTQTFHFSHHLHLWCWTAQGSLQSGQMKFSFQVQGEGIPNLGGPRRDSQGLPPRTRENPPCRFLRDQKIPWDPYLWGILEYGKSMGKGSHYWGALKIPLMEADCGLLAIIMAGQPGSEQQGHGSPPPRNFRRYALQKDDVGSWKTILSFRDGNFLTVRGRTVKLPGGNWLWPTLYLWGLHPLILGCPAHT